MQVAGSFSVVLIACGQGVPHGFAPTMRLGLIARGLAERRVGGEIWHLGGSPVPNRVARGEWNGYPYQYLPPFTQWVPFQSVRRLINAVGLELAIRLLRRRHGQWVVYVQGLPAYAVKWLRRGGHPVVLDVSEWYDRSVSEKQLVESLPPTAGAIVISRGIEERLRRLLTSVGRTDVLVLRVPILADPTSPVPQPVPRWPSPYALWIGNASGEIGDHLRFLVRVMLRARRRLPQLRIVLVGEVPSHLKRELYRMIADVEPDTDWLIVEKFVPREQLGSAMAAAAALLAPLPRGVRWACCYPTKLADYLLSGGPVLSSATGEVSAELTDGIQALLAAPDDEADFAERLTQLVLDSNLRSRIGQAGRAWAQTHLDYRIHAARIHHFLDQIVQTWRRRSVPTVSHIRRQSNENQAR